jgi:CRP-like cAMP-binding protein
MSAGILPYYIREHSLELRKFNGNNMSYMKEDNVVKVEGYSFVLIRMLCRSKQRYLQKAFDTWTKYSKVRHPYEDDVRIILNHVIPNNAYRTELEIEVLYKWVIQNQHSDPTGIAHSIKLCKKRIAVYNILQHMRLESYQSGDAIIFQGNLPRLEDGHFTILNGHVDVVQFPQDSIPLLTLQAAAKEKKWDVCKKILKHSQLLSKLSSPSGFGELSTLTNAKRAASVRASLNSDELTEILVVPKQSLLECLENKSSHSESSKSIDFLRQSGLASRISPSDLVKVANSMTKKTFMKGEILYMKGEPVNCIYLVVSGDVLLDLGDNMVNGEFIPFGATSPQQCFCLGSSSILGDEGLCGQERIFASTAVILSDAALIFEVKDFGFSFLAERQGTSRYCGLAYKNISKLSSKLTAAEQFNLYSRFDSLRKQISDSYPQRGALEKYIIDEGVYTGKWWLRGLVDEADIPVVVKRINHRKSKKVKKEKVIKAYKIIVDVDGIPKRHLRGGALMHGLEIQKAIIKRDTYNYKGIARGEIISHELLDPANRSSNALTMARVERNEEDVRLNIDKYLERMSIFAEDDDKLSVGSDVHGAALQLTAMVAQIINQDNMSESITSSGFASTQDNAVALLFTEEVASKLIKLSKIEQYFEILYQEEVQLNQMLSSNFIDSRKKDSPNKLLNKSPAEKSPQQSAIYSSSQLPLTPAGPHGVPILSLSNNHISPFFVKENQLNNQIDSNDDSFVQGPWRPTSKPSTNHPLDDVALSTKGVYVQRPRTTSRLVNGVLPIKTLEAEPSGLEILNPNLKNVEIKKKNDKEFDNKELGQPRFYRLNAPKTRRINSSAFITENNGKDDDKSSNVSSNKESVLDRDPFDEPNNFLNALESQKFKVRGKHKPTKLWCTRFMTLGNAAVQPTGDGISIGLTKLLSGLNPEEDSDEESATPKLKKEVLDQHNESSPTFKDSFHNMKELYESDDNGADNRRDFASLCTSVSDERNGDGFSDFNGSNDNLVIVDSTADPVVVTNEQTIVAENVGKNSPSELDPITKRPASKQGPNPIISQVSTTTPSTAENNTAPSTAKSSVDNPKKHLIVEEIKEQSLSKLNPKSKALEKFNEYLTRDISQRKFLDGKRNSSKTSKFRLAHEAALVLDHVETPSKSDDFSKMALLQCLQPAISPSLSTTLTTNKELTASRNSLLKIARSSFKNTKNDQAKLNSIIVRAHEGLKSVTCYTPEADMDKHNWQDFSVKMAVDEQLGPKWTLPSLYKRKDGGGRTKKWGGGQLAQLGSKVDEVMISGPPSYLDVYKKKN